MIVNTIKELDSGLEDAGELLEIAVDEGDDDSIDTIEDDLETFEKIWKPLEVSYGQPGHKHP